MKISHLLLILNGLKDQNMTLIDFSSNNDAHGGVDVLTPTQFSYLGNICVREVNLLFCAHKISLILVVKAKYK
jgi:hypothetical protein